MIYEVHRHYSVPKHSCVQLITWWLVGFFTVQEGDIIHSNSVACSGSICRSHITDAAEPNLRIERITFMILKDLVKDHEYQHY